MNCKAHSSYFIVTCNFWCLLLQVHKCLWGDKPATAYPRPRWPTFVWPFQGWCSDSWGRRSCPRPRPVVPEASSWRAPSRRSLTRIQFRIWIETNCCFNKSYFNMLSLIHITLLIYSQISTAWLSLGNRCSTHLYFFQEGRICDSNFTFSIKRRYIWLIISSIKHILYSSLHS